MLQQLSNFVSRAVPAAEKWSAPLLTLWVGQRACAERHEALQAIQALRAPGAPVQQIGLTMAGQAAADYEFDPWPKTPSLGGLPHERLRQLNLLLWDRIDELLWTDGGQTDGATLAAYVWADDPLAAVAAQLLRLAAQRYLFSAGTQPRTVLVVQLPLQRQLRQTAQAAAARDLLDSLTQPTQWPAAFMEMEDSAPTAQPDLPEQEVYFISGERMLAETGAQLLRSVETQLADAACLLHPAARSPGGRYLPAFRLSGQARQHCLLAGLADSLDQLEADRQGGRWLPVEELLQRLEQQVAREEAGWEQFRAWMSRACVYRSLTAGSEQAVFGDWLNQLYTQWEQQLQQRPVPGPLLDELANRLPRQQLGQYRQQLSERQFRLRETPRPSRSGIGSQSAERSRLLDQLLTERYDARYEQAVQQRIGLLTHCLIERIDRRMESGADEQDYAALREQIGRILKEWQWDGCPDESGLVLQAEDKACLQQLLAQLPGQQPPDYTGLLRFVQQRLPEPDDEAVPVELACQTISPERTRTQPVCLLADGPRRGQQLHRLKLDEAVYSENAMRPVGAQTNELRLFVKVQRIRV